MNFFKSGYGEIPGLFSWSHLIYTILSIGLIVLLCVITRKKSNDQVKKYIKIVSIIVLILEILKIVWNLTLREVVEVNDYVPLYFCSFFIYVSIIFGFSKSTESIWYKFSLLFLFYGGLSGGLAFVLLPTTALTVFPLLQVLSVHSLIYHALMVTCGIWAMRFFKPSLKDFNLYAIGVLIIEFVVLIINFIFDTNFMLLMKPFGIAPLEWIYNNLSFLFPAIMSIGQMVVTFFGAYLVSLIVNRVNKNKMV